MNSQKIKKTVFLLMIFTLLPISSACQDPGHPNISPTYKYPKRGVSKGSSGERGSMLINEIGFAGSVTNDGKLNRDDVFIEFWNKHPRPINMSGWRVEVKGDFNYGFKIPETDYIIPPNGFFVVVSKKDGAFYLEDKKNIIVVPELRFGDHLVEIELRDIDRKLMESAGSDKQRVFAGGYDTETSRSMERAQLVFGNGGNRSRNWHAYSLDTGGKYIKQNYQKNTLASPGESNSPDYSGNASSGNFE